MIDDRGRHEGRLLQTAARRVARTDEALAALLRDHTAVTPAPAPLAGSSRAPQSASRRRPWLLVVAAAAVAVLIGGLVVVSRHDRRQAEPASPATSAAVTTAPTGGDVSIDDLRGRLPALPTDDFFLGVGIADRITLQLTGGDPDDADGGPCIVVTGTADDAARPCAESAGGRGLVYGTWPVDTGTLVAVAVNGEVTVNAIGCDPVTGGSGARVRLSACVVPSRRHTVELRFDTATGSLTTTIDMPATAVVTTTSTTTTIRPTTTTLPLTTLGPVSFRLPADAGPYQYPKPVPPDFVVADDHWGVAGHGTLSVVVENLHPPFPDWELVDEFDVNGLHWKVYDVGPEDGSTTSAWAPLDDTNAVLVGGQAWNDSNDLIRSRVVDIARSLVHNG
ncbi:MAG: hypothetical protein QM733_03620 [Ilumatobacteraceae bacterium]